MGQLWIYDVAKSQIQPIHKTKVDWFQNIPCPLGIYPLYKVPKYYVTEPMHQYSKFSKTVRYLATASAIWKRLLLQAFLLVGMPLQVSGVNSYTF